MAASVALARPTPPPWPAASDQLLRSWSGPCIRRLDGLLQGDYRTLWRGAGVDLADLREYQHHDDVRHIDWNVTARLQQPYVRQFLEDRDLNAWFLLDLSGSVDFGSRRRHQAGGVGRLRRHAGARDHAPRQPRRRAAVRQPCRHACCRRGRSRLHVLELLQRMRQPRPVPAGAVAADNGTALADLLHAAEGAMKRRSLVFVVSDFISRARLGAGAGPAGAPP